MLASVLMWGSLFYLEYYRRPVAKAIYGLVLLSVFIVGVTQYRIPANVDLLLSCPFALILIVRKVSELRRKKQAEMDTSTQTLS